MGGSVSCIGSTRASRVAVLDVSPSASPASKESAAREIAVAAKEREKVVEKERNNKVTEEEEELYNSESHAPTKSLLTSPNLSNSQMIATHDKRERLSPRGSPALSSLASSQSRRGKDRDRDRVRERDRERERQGSGGVRVFSPPEDSPTDRERDRLRPRASPRVVEDAEPDEDAQQQQSLQAEMFLQTAMSLGMDNEDLLFNMMYFQDFENGAFENETAQGPAAEDPERAFTALLSTMQQETLALHSEHNTPYKLHPANAQMKSALVEETFSLAEERERAHGCEDDVKRECQVCKDELDDGCALLRVPQCRHYFHKDCLLRWIELQAWCPVCRAPLAPLNAAHDARDDSLLLDAVSEIVHEFDDDTTQSDYSPAKTAFVRHLDFSAMDQSLLAPQSARESLSLNESSFSLGKTPRVVSRRNSNFSQRENGSETERRQAVEEQRLEESEIARRSAQKILSDAITIVSARNKD